MTILTIKKNVRTSLWTGTQSQSLDLHFSIFSTLCPFLKTISFPPLCSNNIRNVSVNNMAYIFLKSTMMIIWFSTWIKNISWYKYWQMLLCTALLEIMRINYFNFRKFPIISIQYLVVHDKHNINSQFWLKNVVQF